MPTSDELYKMKHCIGLDWKKPKRGVYEAFRNGVMYYDEPDLPFDHRITKAMILAERWNARRYRNEAAKFSEKNPLRPRDLRRSVERLKQYSV